MRPEPYYPLFADLLGRRCVVIGGGLIAQRKVTTLLDYGARITVVSPAATSRLKRYARQGKIRLVSRRFKTGDLDGAWLAYAATDDPAINTLVFRTAERHRIFTNVVDKPPLCSFIAPAMFKRGPMIVAVSTGGASPSLAKRVRDDMARLVGGHYAPMLRLLGGLRETAKRALPRYGDRKKYFDQVVRGRVFQLVKARKSGQARREAMALLARHAQRHGTA